MGNHGASTKRENNIESFIYGWNMTAGALPAAFFHGERRCYHGHDLHPALQAGGGTERRPDDGGAVCLRAQPPKAGGRVLPPLRPGHSRRRVSAGEKRIPGGHRPARGARGSVLPDTAGVPARRGHGGGG